jgi:hypothetical protein
MGGVSSVYMKTKLDFWIGFWGSWIWKNVLEPNQKIYNLFYEKVH